MRVLLLRPQERLAASAERLREAGHDAVALALARNIPLKAALPKGRHGAIIFTSAAAIAALAVSLGGKAIPGNLMALRCFCVGEATAAAARKAGFADVVVGPRDAAALAELLRSQLDAGGGLPLLHVTASEGAFDFAAAVPGHVFTGLVVYETRYDDPGRKALRKALAAAEAVMLHSPRMAAHVAKLVRRHGLLDRLRGLTLVAISEKTAAKLRDAGDLQILVAEKPDEASMVSLLAFNPAASNAQRTEAPDLQESHMESSSDEKAAESTSAVSDKKRGAAKTIDLAASEITHVAGASPSVEGIAEAQGQNSATIAGPPDDDGSQEDEEARLGIEAASNRRQRLQSGEAQKASMATALPKAERRSSVAAMLVSAVLGSLVSLGAVGALNWSGALQAIPLLGGLAGGGTDAETKQAVADLREQLAKLTAAEPAAQQPDTELAGRVTALEQRIEQIAEEANALKQDTGAQSGIDAAAIEGRFGELSGRIDEALGAVAELKSSTAAAAGQGTAAAIGDADILKTQIAGLEEKLAALSLRTDGVEQQVAASAEKQAKMAESGKVSAAVQSLASLEAALGEGKPFAAMIEPIEALVGSSPELENLKAVAQSGVPAGAALVAELDALTPTLFIAPTNEEQGVLGRILENAQELITVRPEGPVLGSSPQAILSRIRDAVQNAYYKAAIDQMKTLPQTAQDKAKDWIARVQIAANAKEALSALSSQVNAARPAE